MSFEELLFVEQPVETLKKYNDGILICLCCSKCRAFKAYPNDYLDTYGRLNDICSECLKEKVIDCRLSNMIKCTCGIKYYCATFEARQKHEASEKHINALKQNKNSMVKHFL